MEGTVIWRCINSEMDFNIIVYPSGVVFFGDGIFECFSFQKITQGKTRVKTPIILKNHTTGIIEVMINSNGTHLSIGGLAREMTDEQREQFRNRFR